MNDTEWHVDDLGNVWRPSRRMVRVLAKVEYLAGPPQGSEVLGVVRFEHRTLEPGSVFPECELPVWLVQQCTAAGEMERL